MARVIRPRSELFLDTSYAIALAAPTDQFHPLAVELSLEIERAAAHLITTRGVMMEFGNSLARLRYRAVAIELLAALETDPTVTILPLTDDLYARGYQLYASRPDKEWGLIDCISFVVMTDRGLTEALTADDHFTQAGFVALLRDAA